MANLILNGSTSGSVTLSSPAVSGTTTLTLPTTSGTVVVTSGAQTIEFADGSASTPSITNSGDTNTGIFFADADTIAASTGGSERMRITSTGKCLFATTDTGLSGDFSIAQTTSASACMSLWNTATSGNNLLIQFYTDGGAGRGSIDLNRAAAQIRYNTTSDVTLKNLIGDSNCQKSTDILKSTRIREYAWKNDVEQKPQIGVIAQELYETYKGAVSVGGEYEKTDEQGNITKEYKPWEVDKTAFTFHLIAGWQVHEKLIQEQQAIIKDLKARIETLEIK
jgi:hypothetical protein